MTYEFFLKGIPIFESDITYISKRQNKLANAKFLNIVVGFSNNAPKHINSDLVYY